MMKQIIFTKGIIEQICTFLMKGQLCRTASLYCIKPRFHQAVRFSSVQFVKFSNGYFCVVIIKSCGLYQQNHSIMYCFSSALCWGTYYTNSILKSGARNSPVWWLVNKESTPCSNYNNHCSFGGKFTKVNMSQPLPLVSTYVKVRRRVNWKSIHSYGNLCDIRCACKTPPLFLL